MPLETGQLHAYQKQKIVKNMVQLKKDMDAGELTDYFIQEGIFDFDDVDHITGFNPNTTSSRNKAFLELLFQCSPRAYDVFLLALRENGQQFLVDLLEQTQIQDGTDAFQESQDNGNWIVTIPTHVRKRRLTDKDLTTLSHTLGMNWEFVVYNLGLQRHEVELAQMSSPHSPMMQIFDALLKWRNKYGDEATLEKFVQAVSSSKMASVAWDKLRHIADKMSET